MLHHPETRDFGVLGEIAEVADVTGYFEPARVLSAQAPARCHVVHTSHTIREPGLDISDQGTRY